MWAAADPSRRLPDEAVDRDLLLTNASIYWFTGSGASSAHCTYEGMQAWRQMTAAGRDAPAPESGRPPAPAKGVAVFAADNTIRSVMDPAGMIDHWSEFDCGGHFPAMETPQLLVGDIRDFFRGLR